MKAPLLPKDKKHAEFFGLLFQVRNQAHLRHLKPSKPGQLGSGWEHSALNSFYDGILDMADSLIESYQGKYGLIDISVPSATAPTDVVKTLKDLAEMTEHTAYDSFQESWIKNQLDTMSELIYSTIYKLENLK